MTRDRETFNVIGTPIKFWFIEKHEDRHSDDKPHRDKPSKYIEPLHFLASPGRS